MSRNQRTWDISAVGERELDEKLSERYGVDEIWHQGDYDDGEDGYWLEVLLYWDGEQEHFLADDVPVYGHGPSGAVGCFVEELPDREDIRAKVANIEGDVRGSDGGDA